MTPGDRSGFAVALMLALGLALSACGERAPRALDALEGADFGPAAYAAGFSAPSPATAAANAALAERLALGEAADFEAARRGFIATDDGLLITGETGNAIWSAEAYAFLAGEAPASVNPSLWRQAQLNNIHGLFEVTPGIHQVRGYDLANMTVIEGETGRILIDPLTTVETARAALALVNRELGPRPVSAILFTHSHIDHFGGVQGILEGAELVADLPILAPAGFLEEAVSENVLAGAVMGRRAEYMYGSLLPRSVRGHVDSGLGKQVPGGTYTIARPTRVIGTTGERLTIDGVPFVFQYTPDSEAPAEMTFFLPDHRVWVGAEIVSRTLHNLYTLRGAKVRDALKWSGYIQEAIELFGADIEIIANSHHWPVFGNADARAYLARQRDIYKFIHDQTLRLAGQGLTPDEIAETIRLPAPLEEAFDVRGYYGTLKHNARAVYQFYFGWFDGNPAHLDPLMPADRSARYVEAMGGLESVIERAETAAALGDYRWAAELLNHAVFADPDDAAARLALAGVYDQLGYQAESGPWRAIYLTGAYELRHGRVPRDPMAGGTSLAAEVPLDLLFSAMATRLDPEKAAGKRLTFNFHFTDTDERFVLWVENAVLHHRPGAAESPDTEVRLTRPFWLQLTTGAKGLEDMITSRDFAMSGDRAALLSFFGMLDEPTAGFAIVTP